MTVQDTSLKVDFFKSSKTRKNEYTEIGMQYAIEQIKQQINEPERLAKETIQNTHRHIKR